MNCLDRVVIRVVHGGSHERQAQCVEVQRELTELRGFAFVGASSAFARISLPTAAAEAAACLYGTVPARIVS